MGDAMAHRGPDASGTHLSPDGQVGLSHRRLSILDLSPAGAQPMFSADKSLVLSFNGEVYNFRDIRAELEAKGHAFRGGSDTEVMLAAFR
ncbi:MAG TPA: asparagine synthetase B, partial [Deltaproteobacteria bacterium]|nr:asparagine synthetase B [Deltaproteobacteria bacterium]